MIFLVDMLTRSGWLQKVTAAVPAVEVWVEQIDWTRVSYQQILELKQQIKDMPDKVSVVEFRRRLGRTFPDNELESFRDGAYVLRELHAGQKGESRQVINIR